MNRWITVSVAGLVVLGVMIPFLSPRDAGVPLAFADVKKNVLRTKSVQYVLTRTDDDGRGPQTSQVSILGRYLQRTENGTDHVTIENARTGKYVSLDTKAKVCTVLQKQVTLYPDGSRTENDVQPLPKVDFYAQIVNLPDKPQKRLPKKKIGDKTVVGFYFEKKVNGDTWQRTYWVDPKSKLPVRIEVNWIGKGGGTSKWVMSDFIYNEIKDRKLFSTEPPKGYTVKEGKIFGVAP